MAAEHGTPTPADSSSSNSTPSQSPRPNRDAFLRRLEERQRQIQRADNANDEGGVSPEAGTTQEVPGGGDAVSAGSGKGGDQKRPAATPPAGAAATPSAGAAAASVGAASTPTSARRRSGIPPPRASSSSSSSSAERMKRAAAKERSHALRQGSDSQELQLSTEGAGGNGTTSRARKDPEVDGTEEKAATEPDNSSEPAAKASASTITSKHALKELPVQEIGATAPSAITEITTANQVPSSAGDRNDPKGMGPTEIDANAATPLILSYLSECGISLTADLGIFVPATTANGPAGQVLTQRLEDVFDPVSLQALLDTSRKRKGDHIALPDEEGGGEGKGKSLANAHAYMERVKKEFADRPEVYNEFVELVLDLENDKIDIHNVARKVVTLFRGHDDLISSFNEHLPNACRIEVTDLNDIERSSAPAASGEVPAEKSFEEERWEDYKRARAVSSAAVKASASEAGDGDGGGDGDGDDTSTVPPLREIRDGAPSASAPTATGSNDANPSYSRRISDLTMPPSLAISGVRTSTDTVRTDATVIGDVGGASNAEEEQEEDIDLSTLEPWQRALFRRIDEQTRLVRQIEGRVDALAETMRIQQQQQQLQTFGHQQSPFGQRLPFQQPGTAMATSRTMEIPQNRDEAVQMLRNITPPPGGSAPGIAQQVGGIQPEGQPFPNQRQQQQQQFFFLSLLELLVEGVITILTAPYAVGLHITSVLSTLRPVRLLRHLYREADRRGVLRRFDLSLLFKFVFVSAILAGRTGGARRRRGGNRAGGGAELLSLADLWDRHRLSILIGGTVLALLYQTGFVNLVWDVIVKEDAIGMIWRDEDLRNEEGDEGAGVVAEAANNVNDDDAVARGGIGAGVNAEGGEGNGAPNNQDVNQANNAPEGGGGVAAGAADARQPARRAPRPRPAPPQQQGFFGGGIEPVPADGGFSALGFVVDIIYIIGSLFLSLLPAWHPEPIRRPPRDPQPRANVAGDNGDGDANNEGDGTDAMNGDDNEDPVQENE